MKIPFVLALMCLCAPPAAYGEWQWQELPRRTCRECVIVKGYEPVNNHTRLMLKLLHVADVPDGKMYFSLARDIGEDSTGRPIQIAHAGISFVARTIVEIKDGEVLMLADGKPISLGRAPLGSTATIGDKKISSYLSAADWDSISKLGLAGKLEMRFGGMEIQLSGEHRAAIRDFLAYAEGGN